MPTKLALSPSVCHQRLVREIEPELRFRGGDVPAWQRKLRRKLAELMGFDRMPKERCPLRPRTLWTREHPLGVIHKIALTCEPGADAVAYLCLPNNATPPYRAFVCVQGHSSGMHHSIGVAEDETTPIDATPNDYDYGLQCMRRGLAAICLEQRAFGERREQVQDSLWKGRLTCPEAVNHALALGRTLLGERVYDVDRAIDYLATRRDIDLTDLGIVGDSGGGLVSELAGALLPRIKVLLPAVGFCTYRDSILSIPHCSDNYIPSIMRYAEMADIVGLCAPKPIVLIAGREDRIFPIKGVRKAFRDLQRIYAAAGAPQHCRLVVGPGGHRFYADLGWRALERMRAKS